MNLANMTFSLHFTLAFAFGILGNIVSFGVSLSPLPTFYRIYKKKNAKGYQSIPYVVSLFSAMLWIYYALLKTNSMLLITINTFCVFIQTFFIFIHFFYSPRREKIVTIKLFLLFIVFGFGAVLLSTIFVGEVLRLAILGYICMGFSLGVFAAPLCILRKVIKTKSAEFMPFYLSLFLTLGAVMWFGYGLLSKDMNIAIPNVLGFAFGILQMVLYGIYRKAPKPLSEIEVMMKHEKTKLGTDHMVIHIVKLNSVSPVKSKVVPLPIPATELQKVMAKMDKEANGFRHNPLYRRGAYE